MLNSKFHSYLQQFNRMNKIKIAWESRMGKKRMRGQPILYDECKKNFTIAVLPSSMKKFDALANDKGISRAELFDRLCKNYIHILEQVD